MSELVRIARSAPDRINYASAGNGTTSHLAGVLLASLANVRLVHVPWRS